MSIIKQVPIAADGGYWYVSKPIYETLENGIVGGKIPPIASPYCAWYVTQDGVDYVVTRSPTPRATGYDTEEITVEEALQLIGLGIPKGRIEGK